MRSPEAPARIVSTATAVAVAHPGVHAVYTGEDLADLLELGGSVVVPAAIDTPQALEDLR